MAKRIVVAIDGPAGAGKSTVARAVAERLGFLYIDTGAMYRAVAFQALRDSIDLDDLAALEAVAEALSIELVRDGARVLANGEDITENIRQAPVSAAASRVSAVPGVRRALVAHQRRLAERHSVVMEGRDIGTVVFPDAEVKVFLDAQPGTRAERRADEMHRKGVPASVAQVGAEMARRDERDRTRAESPLLQAPDALYMDTTRLTLDEVQEALLKLIRDRLANGKEVDR